MCLFLLKTPWLPALVSHVHSPLLKTAAWLSLASSGQSKTAIGKPDSGAPESSLTGETQLWTSACSNTSLLLLNKSHCAQEFAETSKEQCKEPAIKEHATLNTSILEYTAHAWVTNKRGNLVCTEQKSSSLSHVGWTCWLGQLSGMIYL